VRRAWRDLTSAERRRELGWYRSARKLAVLGYASIRIAASTITMFVLARLPHESVEQLPVALEPEVAAKPTAQPGD
jgi:hypothetical protein